MIWLYMWIAAGTKECRQYGRWPSVRISTDGRQFSPPLSLTLTVSLSLPLIVSLSLPLTVSLSLSLPLTVSLSLPLTPSQSLPLVPDLDVLISRQPQHAQVIQSLLLHR